MNNLGSFRVLTRPTKHHWSAQRPPVQLSIAQLENQLYLVGNQEDTRTLLQYNGTDKVKLCLDCDKKSSVDISPKEAFAEIEQQVLAPIIAFIREKTQKTVQVDELCIESACRQLRPGEWKHSFHIYFPMISIQANKIQHLLDRLSIPSELADRAPWRGITMLFCRRDHLCHNFTHDVLGAFLLMSMMLLKGSIVSMYSFCSPMECFHSMPVSNTT